MERHSLATRTRPAAPPALSMLETGPIHMVGIFGPLAGVCFRSADDTVVGRDTEVGLCIEHPSVSRRHASLRKRLGGWTVTDEGSTNGTFVNGVRVTGSAPLRQDDVLAFGTVVVKVSITRRRTVTEVGRPAAGLDGLTGLFTRRYFERRLAEDVADAYRRRQPLSLAYIDIDGLDALNDEFGREVGDRILMDVATLLRSRVRRSDVVARFAGDEFVVSLDEVSLSIAVRVGRRLLKAIRTHLVGDGQRDYAITASVGVASTERRWISWEELLDDAQDATQRAQNRGGNRVCA